MPTEQKCDNSQCKQVSIGLLSVAPSNRLWVCQDHIIQIIKEVQEKHDKRNIQYDSYTKKTRPSSW